MNDNEVIFENYLKEKKGIKDYLKEPRSWLYLFGIIVAVVLVALFYQTVIVDRMTNEEVSQSLEVITHNTIWVVKETTPYEVKIVPSITFKVKNTGRRDLRYVSFGGVFEYVESGEVQNDGAAMAFREPLKPGETSDDIIIKSPFGYSAPSKAAFFRNKPGWKKMRVKLFASTKGSGPTPIGDVYPIKQLIEGFSEDTGETRIEKENEISKKSFEKIGTSIHILGHDSIWVDRFKSKEKTIIVPSITFQIKNIGQESLQDVIFKGEFFFQDNEEKLGDGIVVNLKKPLKPGETSKDITINSELGYEAKSKAAIVKNTKEWRLVKVKIFAKQVDFNYVLLGTYPISQEIEGVKVIYKIQ